MKSSFSIAIFYYAFTAFLKLGRPPKMIEVKKKTLSLEKIKSNYGKPRITLPKLFLKTTNLLRMDFIEETMRSVSGREIVHQRLQASY